MIELTKDEILVLISGVGNELVNVGALELASPAQMERISSALQAANRHILTSKCHHNPDESLEAATFVMLKLAAELETAQ